MRRIILLAGPIPLESTWIFLELSTALTRIKISDRRQFPMSTEEDPLDSDLLRSMLAGDEDALAALYRRRQGSIYRFALQMSGSPALAEYVTQEVFMVLLRDGKSYDSTRGPLNWFLLGIARNLTRQRLGREKFYAPLMDDESGRPLAHDLRSTRDPLDELSRNQ